MIGFQVQVRVRDGTTVAVYHWTEHLATAVDVVRDALRLGLDVCVVHEEGEPEDDETGSDA